MSTHKTQRLIIAVLLIFYLVGFSAIAITRNTNVLVLTPGLLLLSTGLALIPQKPGFRFYTFFLGGALVTYLIEVAGVKTGYIFGSYHYGENLGFKIWGVPLIIGINWMLLSYATHTLCRKIPAGLFVRSLIGALMLVAIDIFIEPLSGVMDFWYWENGIPLQNFVAWFIIGWVIQLMLEKSGANPNNKVVIAVYGIQLAFFAALHLVLL